MTTDSRSLEVRVSLRDEVSAGLNRMAQGFKHNQQAISVALLGMGTAIAGVGFLSIRTFARMGEEIHDMALRTGFSAQALSELGFAAKLAGTDLRALEAAVIAMARFTQDASDGLDTAQRAMSKLGLSTAQLRALSPEEAFFTTAAAVADVSDAMERLALAQDVFGRGGAQLLPLLAEGAEGLRRARAEARRLGVTFDEDSARAAAEFDDAMVELKASVQGVQIALGAGLAPVLRAIAGIIGPPLVAFGDLMRGNKILATAVGITTVALGGMLLTLGTIGLAAPKIVAGYKAIAAALRVLRTTIVLTTSSARTLRLALIGTGIGALLLAGGIAAEAVMSRQAAAAPGMDTGGLVRGPGLVALKGAAVVERFTPTGGAPGSGVIVNVQIPPSALLVLDSEIAMRKFASVLERQLAHVGRGRVRLA